MLPPIDILWGHGGLREGVDAGASVDEILSGVSDELADFSDRVRPHLRYG